MSKLDIKYDRNVLELPQSMGRDYAEGRLVISIKMGKKTPEGVEVPEEFDLPDNPDVFVVEADLEVGDLGNEDIIGCDPDVFLKNGIIAAILDAIRNGLAEPRGISINEAVELAQGKAQEAMRVTHMLSLLDKLSLSLAEPEGSA